jgi:hypothetical protein
MWLENKKYRMDAMVCTVGTDLNAKMSSHQLKQTPNVYVADDDPGMLMRWRSAPECFSHQSLDMTAAGAKKMTNTMTYASRGFATSS